MQQEKVNALRSLFLLTSNYNRFTTPFLISSSISRYRAKDLLPSLCPLIAPTILGSLTFYKGRD